MSKKKPLVVAFVSDTLAAIKGTKDLAKSIDGVGEQSGKAQEALGEVGKVSEDAAKAGAAAFKALGVQTEEIADKRIAKLRDEFDTLKKAGVGAPKDIERAQAAMEAKIAQINKSIGRDAKKTWRDIADDAIKSLKKIDAANVQRASRAAVRTGVGAGLAAGAAGLGIGVAAFGTIKEQAGRADELIKLSRATQTNVETLSAYAFAAEQSGVATATFAAAFKGLRTNISAVQKGAEDNPFQKLGIATRTSTGELRQLDDVLREAVDKLSQVEDETQRAILASEIFGGKAGPEMASSIELGAKGLDDYITTAQKFGLVVTESSAVAAETFNDRLDDISQRLLGLRAEMSAPFFLPFSEVFVQLGEMIDRNKAKIIEFGSAVASRVLSVVEDLIAIIEGRDGDVQNTWILDFFKAAQNVGSTIKDVVIPLIADLAGFIAFLGPTLGKVAIAALLFGSVLTPILAIATGIGAALTLAVGVVGAVPLAIAAAIVAAIAAIAYFCSSIKSILPSWLGGGKGEDPEAAVARAIAKAAPEEAAAAGIGTPVNLTIENREYKLNAPEDVARALAADQNAKSMRRPTSTSRTSR